MNRHTDAGDASVTLLCATFKLSRAVDVPLAIELAHPRLDALGRLLGEHQRILRLAIDPPVDGFARAQAHGIVDGWLPLVPGVHARPPRTS